jgi:hypothetical protein
LSLSNLTKVASQQQRNAAAATTSSSVVGYKPMSTESGHFISNRKRKGK